jgi:hypothetical protein
MGVHTDIGIMISYRPSRMGVPTEVGIMISYRHSRMGVPTEVGIMISYCPSGMGVPTEVGIMISYHPSGMGVSILCFSYMYIWRSIYIERSLIVRSFLYTYLNVSLFEATFLDCNRLEPRSVEPEEAELQDTETFILQFPAVWICWCGSRHNKCLHI